MPSLDSPLPNPNSEVCPEPFGRAQDRFAKRSKVFCSYPSPLLSYVFCFAFISVAVGTALASGPPHRSVREGLPHTALTSGSSDGPPLVGIQMPSLLAACRTRHNLCDSLPRLCVRHECACGAFPLVALLPSADSAANASAPALFARFVGTMRPSDSLQTCMSTLRLLAFFDRPALLSSVGVCRVSRFPRMEFPHVPRVSDSAVSKDRSRLTLPFMLPSPYQDTVGTPKW